MAVAVSAPTITINTARPKPAIPMGAPLFRFPIDFLNQAFYGPSVVILGFMLLVVAYDLYSLGRVQRATTWGVGYSVFIHLIRIPVAFSSAWAWFAHHMAASLR